MRVDAALAQRRSEDAADAIAAIGRFARRIAPHVLVGVIAAALAGAAVGLDDFVPVRNLIASWRADAPDPSRAGAAAAAFVAAFIISAALPAGGSLRRFAGLRVLALLNSALFFAALFDPWAALSAGGAIILWKSWFSLSASGDERTTVAFALSIAAAPLVSTSALLFYPPLLAGAALLSPWGLAPRRVLGFLTVIVAPLLLLAAGAAYLVWLFSASGGATALLPTGEPREAHLRAFALLALAPAAIAASLGRAPDRRRRLAAMIFLVSAAGAIRLGATLGVALPVLVAAIVSGHIAWASLARRPIVVLVAGYVAGAFALLVAASPDAVAAFGDWLARVAPRVSSA